MLAWIDANATSLAAVGAAIAFVWSAVQFILVRNREKEAQEFEFYHRLVKELVAPDPESKVAWIDRQIAVVFELRHFPRYFEVTRRILTGLREKWSNDPEFKWPRLIEEIDLTLQFMGKKT